MMEYWNVGRKLRLFRHQHPSFRHPNIPLFPLGCGLYRIGVHAGSEIAVSQFSIESAVENGGHERVEFGGGLGVETLQHVHLCLQVVEPDLIA